MAANLDLRWMERAAELAQQGFPAPNPRVGCVIVRDGVVVGEGFHLAKGTDHAEVVALKAAGIAAKGADAYVTLEPCNHVGQTGPCSHALVEAGVRRVAYAVEDPNPKAKGGRDYLEQHGLEVIVNFGHELGEECNFRWLRAMRRRRPYVYLKAAITLDGFIARTNGESKWITGINARRRGHALRAEMGSVLVGRNTVQLDQPQLTCRHVEVINQPTRVILDPQQALSPDDPVFDSAAPTVRLVRGEPLEVFDVAVPTEGTVFTAEEILDVLWKQGLTGILIEGGAGTYRTFLKSGLVDEFVLFQSTKTFGDGICWTGGWATDDLGMSVHSIRTLHNGPGEPEDIELTLRRD